MCTFNVWDNSGIKHPERGKEMKKMIVAAALTLMFAFSVAPTFATETQQPTTQVPQQTTVNQGKFYVDIGGASSAWADAQKSYTKSMSGGQFAFSATRGDENNGLSVMSVGGYLSEGEGQKFSNTGGYTKGWGEWGTSFTSPNYGN
ncbi:TPA: hypothetical protein DEP58_05285 [Patescibacteria group bacterium]|nr:hypothetical protein [Patescibacteria group bacterium]